jgi:hypothetical protein
MVPGGETISPLRVDGDIVVGDKIIKDIGTQ